MISRSRNIAILLAILALVLAACGPTATPTPTIAPTSAPTEEAVVEATAEAVEATEEAVVEATEEAVVEATEEAVVEATEEAVVEATEEAVVEATEEAVVEATEEAVVEATEEAVVEATEEAVVEATEEAVVEATEEAVVEATEEAVVEATEEAVVEATEEAVVEATEEPIVTEQFTDGNFSFSYTSDYALQAGNGLYVLSNGDKSVVVVNYVTYATVLGGVSFDDNAAALAFYLDRTGYTVGEATADGVAVELARRNQVGTASLVDLGAGNYAVVLALGADAANQPTDLATLVKDTVSIPSIMTTALTTDGLGTLATALVRGGLARTFNSEGAYTVFAPSDEAFAAALEAMGMTADELLANDELLNVVLPYHVVAGVLKSSDLTDGLVLTTLNGATLTVTIVDGTVMVTDAAGMSYSVVTADVVANNGVVHVIDGVLSPVAAEATPEATAEATEAGS